VNAIGSTLNATLSEFVEERIWVLYQKPQADGAHFVFELKLHVELDRVTPKPDVVRRIRFVSKRQLEAKLLGVELNRPADVAGTENRMGLFEHHVPASRDRSSPRRESHSGKAACESTLWLAEPDSIALSDAPAVKEAARADACAGLVPPKRWKFQGRPMVPHREAALGR
jgi:hypothetical protein